MWKKIDDLNIDLYDLTDDDVYYETNGIFHIINTICPYKNAIDEAKCSKDTHRTYKTSIELNDYYHKPIVMQIDNEKVSLDIKDFEFSKIFFDRVVDDGVLDNVKIIIKKKRLHTSEYC